MLRIDLCQCKLSFENPEENLATMERFLLYAGEIVGHLVLFPELTLTGFTMKSREFALTKDSDFIERVRRMAVRHKTAVGFGCVIDENGSGPQNTYMIIDKEGNLIAEYAKLHPFSYAGENRHYRPGNSLSTFTLDGVRFGITVCYDLRFPEIYQAYAENCDAVIVAANWPSKRAEHWNALLTARAIETQCFMIGVNCVRGMDGQYYRGDSRIVGPDGIDIPYAWRDLEEDGAPAGRTADIPCVREDVSSDDAPFSQELPDACGGDEDLWADVMTDQAEQDLPDIYEEDEDFWLEQEILEREEEDWFPQRGKTGILMAWVKETQAHKERAAFPVRQDRRNELYRSLLS